jgi:hypothetical protein
MLEILNRHARLALDKGNTLQHGFPLIDLEMITARAWARAGARGAPATSDIGRVIHPSRFGAAASTPLVQPSSD